MIQSLSSSLARRGEWLASLPARLDQSKDNTIGGDMSIVKVCKHHGELTEDKTWIDKRKNQRNCKICHAARVKRWNENNKEKRRKIAKKWALNHPEQLKEIKRKNHLENKEFNNLKSRKRYAANREQEKKSALERYHKNPKPLANARLKRLYGITLDQYNKMLSDQYGKCAICKMPETLLDNKQKDIRKLAVDHCHSTNRIRGLVCFRCNTILGKVDDSVELLNQLIDYLMRYMYID